VRATHVIDSGSVMSPDFRGGQSHAHWSIGSKVPVHARVVARGRADVTRPGDRFIERDREDMKSGYHPGVQDHRVHLLLRSTFSTRSTARRQIRVETCSAATVLHGQAARAGTRAGSAKFQASTQGQRGEEEVTASTAPAPSREGAACWHMENTVITTADHAARGVRGPGERMGRPVHPRRPGSRAPGRSPLRQLAALQPNTPARGCPRRLAAPQGAPRPRTGLRLGSRRSPPRCPLEEKLGEMRSARPERRLRT